MKNILALIVFILSTHFAWSQADFREGFVVTTQGDSLAGYIDYRVGDKNFSTCSFRSTENGAVKDYAPGQVTRYGFFGDKQFLSHTIAQEEDSVDVFLEILVEGRLSLFLYEGRFFVMKNERLFELTNEQISRSEGARTMMGHSHKYIGILKSLTFDCPGKQKIDYTLKLQERHLTRFVNEYNSCIGAPSINFKDEKPWFAVSCSPELAYIRSYLKFISTREDHYHLQGDFDPDNTWALGFLFFINSPRINERLSFITGLRYIPVSYISHSLIENQFHKYNNEVIVDIDELKIPLGFQYRFPEHNYTPYIQAGLSMTWYLSSTNTWTQIQETSDHVVTTTVQSAVDLQNYELGIWGGIGLFKSINDALGMHLELRYEQTNGISEDRFYEPSVVRNLELAFGVDF